MAQRDSAPKLSSPATDVVNISRSKQEEKRSELPTRRAIVGTALKSERTNRAPIVVNESCSPAKHLSVGMFLRYAFAGKGEKFRSGTQAVRNAAGNRQRIRTRVTRAADRTG